MCPYCCLQTSGEPLSVFSEIIGDPQIFDLQQNPADKRTGWNPGRQNIASRQRKFGFDRAICCVEQGTPAGIARNISVFRPAKQNPVTHLPRIQPVEQSAQRGGRHGGSDFPARSREADEAVALIRQSRMPDRYRPARARKDAAADPARGRSRHRSPRVVPAGRAAPRSE